MTRIPLPRPVLIVLIAALIAGGGWGAWRVVNALLDSEPAPMETTGMRGIIVMSPPLPLPAFQLFDGGGTPLTNAKLRGRWTMIYFGYTHCPDICPTTLQTLAKVRAKLDPSQRADTQVLFVSLDPKRDTPAVIKDYAAHFDASFIAATAPKADLDVLTQPLGVIYEFEGDTGTDDYTLGHYGAVFILDPKARLRAYILPPHETARVAEAYARIRAYYGAPR